MDPTHPLQVAEGRRIKTFKMVEDVNEDPEAPEEIKKPPKNENLQPSVQEPGYYSDGMPHPAPPPQPCVKVHPEDLPWEVLREEYTPNAHAYFVKEIELAFRNTTQPNANQLATFWAVHPIVWASGAGKTQSSPQPTNVRPMRGGAWFSSRDLATAYLHQIRLGWESWTRVLGFPQSQASTMFALSGPWSQAEMFRFTAGGPASLELFANKHVSIEPEDLDGDLAELRKTVLAARVNELFQALEEADSDITSGYRKLLWDDQLEVERFPHWWVDPAEIPHEYFLADEASTYAGSRFYGFVRPGQTRPAPWRPAVVVPWIEKRDKSKPSDVLIVPTPQPIAIFEHDGLACDFARALAFAIGHVQGRVPEDYEQPYTFNQFFVYGQIQVGNMWSGGSPTRFASWCKCHPSIFVAGATHGGVTVAVSENGYASDNKPIPLTQEMGAKMLKGYVTSDGKDVNLDFLDCPPTPNTAAVMDSEEFPTELFTTT
jgi:hypothetical protein